MSRLRSLIPRPWPSLAAIAGGLLAGLAHPPFGFLPGLLAFGLMMRLGEAAASHRSAFWRGWLFGTAYFGIGCWWVAEAFYVDAETFGWMAPFAVAALAGGLALFWGLALLAYRAVATPGAARVLVFAGVLSAFEWVRGHVFTGFPWDMPGVAWAAGGAVSQAAALMGAYALTYVTVAIAAAPALLADGWRRRQALVAVAAAALTLGLLYGYGALRLRTSDTSGPTMTVRAVQPNIPQAAKYDEAQFESMLATYLALTSEPSSGTPPTIIAWPEGALPYSLNRYLAPGDPARAAIAAALKPRQVLLIGGYRYEGEKLFNTMAAVRREGDDLAVVAIYDKHRLVPFGEYVPGFLARIGMRQLVPLEDFSEGPRPSPLDIGPTVIQPLICYESLFPDLVRRGADPKGPKARLIVNISNDAWFGATSGPLQHLNQARYRAIEAGLPMMRATPTGVSAVIDAHGRIVGEARLPHGTKGVADAAIPAEIVSSTPYSRLGEAIFLAGLAISGLIALFGRRKSAESA